MLANEGRLDLETVAQHLMKVNQCDRRTFQRYVNRVFAQLEERSSYEWKVDLGEYANLVGPRGTKAS